MDQFLNLANQALAFPITLIRWPFLGNSTPEVAIKIGILLLPILLLSVLFWTSCASLLTLAFRPKRTHLAASLLITWWDAGRATFSYWAGLLRFIFLLVGAIYGLCRLAIVGPYQILREILFSPITLIKQMASSYSGPGIPWVAVLITISWIILEAIIFTFILSPLVQDILSGMTNVLLSRTLVSSGLFVFLFMIVGGSLACMHALVEAIDKRNTFTIAKMVAIESVVMMVEVVFFYREFVEAILPFFNRMSGEGLQFGPLSILAIGAFAWLGVRSSAWFFFGKYGTPTLLLIIAREGMEHDDLGLESPHKYPIGKPAQWIKQLVREFQGEINWLSDKSKEITEAFILPPLQIFAVMANSAMMTLTTKNLFNLPIQDINDLKDTKGLIKQVSIDIKEA